MMIYNIITCYKQTVSGTAKVNLLRGPVEIEFMMSKHWNTPLVHAVPDYRDYLLQTTAQLDGVAVSEVKTKILKTNKP